MITKFKRCPTCREAGISCPKRVFPKAEFSHHIAAKIGGKWQHVVEVYVAPSGKGYVAVSRRNPNLYATSRTPDRAVARLFGRPAPAGEAGLVETETETTKEVTA